MLCNLKSPQRRPRSRLRLRLLEATLEAAVSVQHAVGGDELTKDLESKFGTATEASQDDRPVADKLANYRGYMSLQRTRGYTGGRGASCEDQGLRCSCVGCHPDHP